MLPEDDQRRIAEEEEYRATVRLELETAREKSKPLSERIVRFLSSALGIWLLSTVAVGAITGSYGALSSHQSDARRKSDEARRLDIEIMHRLRIIRSSLLNVSSGQPFRMSIAYYVDMDQASPNSLAPRLNALFPEFDKQTMESLLFQLSSDLDRAEASRIAEVIASWERMTLIRDELFNKLENVTTPVELGGEGLLGLAADVKERTISKDVAARSLKELDGHFRLARWSLADGTNVLDLARSTYIPSRAHDRTQRPGPGRAPVLTRPRDPTGIPPVLPQAPLQKPTGR
jgi:hypothetical protein